MGSRNLFSRIFVALAGGLVVFIADFSPALGTELFADDFEDMTANRWHVGGDGTVQVDTFGGSEALRLTKRGYAIAAVRIDGEFAVKIEVALGATSLEKGDHCVAEASADGGAVWTDVLRLNDGEDEGDSWQYGEADLMLPGAMSTLAIRLRSEGDSNSDICWADDVRVTILDAMSP
ncbi:MAG: hypothetical protein EP347_10970 [Alphaproteobacteria bacterium]|nr:MAG: hypothetical protein EP347_10970 [Alphaproteobacteria bacterium]